ncbi:AsmA family protein [Thiobacillus denitrificans]|uniref:AsmA family protein n=1 Tax=Thiobacillus denitrificans TaxID=36861 RepID=UPI00036C6CF7|nr:AsmA family protein [Thiobacillus denitrificans]
MRAPLTLPRQLKWVGVALGLVTILGVILASLPNWNALRGPLARVVGDKTGRELNIGGDLKISPGWPILHVHASDVTFSNPAWAREKNMIEVREVTLGVAIPSLFHRRLAFDEVHLDRAGVYLEKSPDGRKNWLLDRNQRDDKARVVIRRLAVRDGRIDYRDPAQRTHLIARVSTPGRMVGKSVLPLQFRVEGHYKGQPLTAAGAGDSVLALRDDGKRYRLSLGGRIGPTAVRAYGHVTDLLKLSAVDLQIALRGGSLAQLYPVLGIVFPDTPPYATRGRLVRSGKLWRYEKFQGRIGRSDIAGTLQVDTGAPRPFLTATLDSTRLTFSDLGPLVGTRDTQQAATRDASTRNRVLPAVAFRTGRWPRMDADVTLNAQSIERPDALPIDHLSTRLRLNDAVLRLDPLKFDVAGGTLAGTVKLDGRQDPIKAAVDLKARSLRIARLFPTADLNQTSIGEFNGNIELAGEGDSVAAMLGNADGQVAMVVDGGIISKLMMETVSLHLLEMLQLKLAGDEVIRIRCGVADFGVKEGIMQARALILDTDIVRIDGSGRIDLRQEKLDLRIVPRSKKLSLVALRTPIHLEGRFSGPEVSLDKGKLAMRGLAAVALGAVNPALGLIPLIETRTGVDSECRRLIAETDART